MPIIDMTGRKKKYRYLVNGSLGFRGSHDFEFEIIAEDENDAREQAESMAIDDYSNDVLISDLHDDTEFETVEQGDEVIEPIINPVPSGISFYSNPENSINALNYEQVRATLNQMRSPSVNTPF